MSSVTDILLTILGLAIVAGTLIDIFHRLFHPSGRGQLSHLIAAGVWRFSKLFGDRFGHSAGPLAVVTVIIAWALLQALGWALIYYPHVPEGFSYSPSINPQWYSVPAEALYISLVTLATLGFGDVVPIEPWVRLAAPVQALIGFALLTAALSWFSQIYPALGRRRALAVRLHLLEANRYADHLDELGAATASRALEEIAAGIMEARIDMTQNTETYYFREIDPRTSFAASLAYAVTLSDRAKVSPVKDVQLSGCILRAALDDLARLVQQQFSATGDTTPQILAFFAHDHGHDAPRVT